MTRVCRPSLGIGVLVAASIVIAVGLVAFKGPEKSAQAGDGCALSLEELGAFVDIPGGGLSEGRRCDVSGGRAGT